jgi:hypothetical protein
MRRVIKSSAIGQALGLRNKMDPLPYPPLFAPKPCECGLIPEVVEMPNYGPDEQWQVHCKWGHPRVYGRTMFEAIEKYNERRK